MLTGIRTGKVRIARFDEITERGTWRPPHSGKHKRSLKWPFEVPLSPRALEIVTEMRRVSKGDYVFTGHSGYRPIEEKGQRRGRCTLAPDYAVHALRASSRDLADKQTTA